MKSAIDIALAASQVFSAFATAAALIILFRQLGEMSRQTQQLREELIRNAYRELVKSEIDLLVSVPEWRRMWREYAHPPRGVKSDRFAAITVAASFYENLYYQHTQGVVPANMWPGWERDIQGVVNSKSFRVVWPFIKPYYYEDFVNFVEHCITNERIAINKSDNAPQGSPANMVPRRGRT